MALNDENDEVREQRRLLLAHFKENLRPLPNPRRPSSTPRG